MRAEEAVNNQSKLDGVSGYSRMRLFTWFRLSVCYIPVRVFNVVTKHVMRRSILLAVLNFMFILSLVSTISFWMFLSYKNTDTADTWLDGRQKQRSLRHWIEIPDIDINQFNAAEMFAIRPAITEEDLSLKTNGVVGQHSECASTSNIVCPENDIPHLVSANTLNLSDISIDEVEHMLLNDRLTAVKRRVEKTNELINVTRFQVNSTFIPCVKAMSNDHCGNAYLKKALASNSLLAANYIYMPGGIWKPKDCLPRWKVAIIIPYRNRSFHLPIVLRYLTTMLQRQRLEFGFYVVEQANTLNFNRAMLMNIGFLESMNFSKWDCFVFHDVDHIPISDHNYYGCSGMPRHFLSGADRWQYKLLYKDFFGAVTGLTRSQIYAINGFPNVYWGWGGEDDEILSRVRAAGLDYTRPKGKQGYYNVIKHHHQSAPQEKERFKLLKNFRPRLTKDGLNNLKYKKPVITLNTLYTNISVDIRKVKVELGLKPQPNKELKPQTDKGSKPQSNMGLKPQSDKGSKSQPDKESKPQLDNDLKPQPDKGSKPQPDKRLKPQPDKGLKLQPDTGLASQPDKRLKPQPDKRLKPQPDKRLKPQPDKRLKPQPDKGLKPQPDKGLKPQPDKGLKPQLDTGLNPQPDTELKSHHDMGWKPQSDKGLSGVDLPNLPSPMLPAGKASAKIKHQQDSGRHPGSNSTSAVKGLEVRGKTQLDETLRRIIKSSKKTSRR